MKKSKPMISHSIKELDVEDLLLDFIEAKMEKSDPVYDYFMTLLESEDEDDELQRV